MFLELKKKKEICWKTKQKQHIYIWAWHFFPLGVFLKCCFPLPLFEWWRKHIYSYIYWKCRFFFSCAFQPQKSLFIMWNIWHTWSFGGRKTFYWPTWILLNFSIVPSVRCWADYNVFRCFILDIPPTSRPDNICFSVHISAALLWLCTRSFLRIKHIWRQAPISWLHIRAERFAIRGPPSRMQSPYFSQEVNSTWNVTEQQAICLHYAVKRHRG